MRKYAEVDIPTIKADNFLIEEYGLDVVLQTLDQLKFVECKKLPNYVEEITKYYDERLKIAKSPKVVLKPAKDNQ